MIKFRAILVAAGAGCLALAAPALADVKAGVDAWEKGDYAAAVAQWRDPAASGDADAQFNLAQAYRLGRGVAMDTGQAEEFYAKAAAQGHLKAGDNYGLLLFQDGRREQALPYVKAAAERGDPRAQYLLGIAHFNGDMVDKDWVRAYALLTNANGAGLPQAAPAIAQMDSFIPLDQRQEAQTLAATLKRNADTQRASQMAAEDLGARGATPARIAQAPAPVRQARPAPSPVARGSSAIPRPIPSTPVPPSVVAARNAVAEAARVTGTSSPQQAGTDFSGRNADAVVAAAPRTAPSSAVRAPAPRPAPAAAPARASADGPWRVQLGAFSVKGNAQRLWGRLASRDVFSGKRSFFVPAGRLTKLQAGGFASRGAAQSACNTVKRGGTDCIVTR